MAAPVTATSACGSSAPPTGTRAAAGTGSRARGRRSLRLSSRRQQLRSWCRALIDGARYFLYVRQCGDGPSRCNSIPIFRPANSRKRSATLWTPKDPSTVAGAVASGLATGGFVNFPTWFAAADPGPISANAEIPGLKRVGHRPGRSSDWDSGDGSIVHCIGLGIDDPRGPEPVRAPTPSVRPRQAKRRPTFPITVSVTWAVSWRASTGQTGTLPDITTTATFPRIGSERSRRSEHPADGHRAHSTGRTGTETRAYRSSTRVLVGALATLGQRRSRGVGRGVVDAPVALIAFRGHRVAVLVVARDVPGARRSPMGSIGDQRRHGRIAPNDHGKRAITRRGRVTQRSASYKAACSSTVPSKPARSSIPTRPSSRSKLHPARCPSACTSNRACGLSCRRPVAPRPRSSRRPSSRYRRPRNGACRCRYRSVSPDPPRVAAAEKVSVLLIDPRTTAAPPDLNAGQSTPVTVIAVCAATGGVGVTTTNVALAGNWPTDDTRWRNSTRRAAISPRGATRPTRPVRRHSRRGVGTGPSPQSTTSVGPPWEPEPV